MPKPTLRSLRCAGCEKGGFSEIGLESHLTQSHDPRCIKANQARLADIAQLFGVDFDDVNTNNDQLEVDDSQAGLFMGDALGSADEYMADDFGQGDGEAGSAEAPILSGDEDENSGEEDELPEEGGWEPERPGAHSPSSSSGLADEPPIDAESGSDLAREFTEAREQAETRAGAKPARTVRYSDKYPRSCAGKIIGKAQSPDASYLGDVDASSNFWAPFKSKLDWEVAKWAKLRGAGSTAFSELLAIEGVRLTF